MAAAADRDVSVSADSAPAESASSPPAASVSLPRTVAIVLFAVGLLFLAAAPEWRGPKSADDHYAISNAYRMVATRGDVSQLFFRSRNRPAFVAYAAPICALFPGELISAAHDYPDFGRDIFYLYARRGDLVFPEVSLATFLFLVVALGAGAWLFSRFARALPAPGVFGAACAAGLAIVLTGLLDDAGLTLAFTFALHLFTLASFLWLRRAPTLARVVVASAALGVGVLAKLDHSVTMTAVAAIQAADLLRRRSPALFVRYAAYWALGALPFLLWYAFALGGVLPELRAFGRDVRDVQWLMGYPTATPAIYWNEIGAALGWLGPLGLGGFLVEAARWLRGRRDAGLGLLAMTGIVLGHWGLLSFPYVFPRFFVYLALPATYFTLTLVWRALAAAAPARWDTDHRAVVFAVAAIALILGAKLAPWPYQQPAPVDNSFTTDFSDDSWRDLFHAEGEFSERPASAPSGGLALPLAGAFLRHTLYEGCRTGTVELELTLPREVEGLVPIARILSRLSQRFLLLYVDANDIVVRFAGGEPVRLPRSEFGETIRVEFTSDEKTGLRLRLDDREIAHLPGVAGDIAHIDLGAFEPWADGSESSGPKNSVHFQVDAPLIVRRAAFRPAPPPPPNSR